MNYMNGKTFVDTNVLIYAHDIDAGPKHEIAKSVIRELWGERAGLLSTQVLQEFYVNVTRKIASPLSKVSARAVIHSYGSWCIETALVDVTIAFQVEDESQIGFWDALVIASAARAGAARLVSEDLNAGQTVLGVRIENPFAAIP
jgi:predicted nucleic acid-binding protein